MKEPCPWCGAYELMVYRAVKLLSKEIISMRQIDDHDCPAWRREPSVYDQADNIPQVAEAMEILSHAQR